MHAVRAVNCDALAGAERRRRRAGFATGGEERRPRWEMPGTHPVVQGVDPFTLSIERSRIYSSPALRPVARSAAGSPLVSVSESPDSRLVVVSFGPDDRI